MNPDLTKHNLGWTSLLAVLLLLLFWVRAQVAPVVLDAPLGGYGPLGDLLLQGFSSLPQWCSSMIGFVSLFWCGVVVSRIVTANMIVLERNYVSTILFVLIACGSGMQPDALPVVIAALLLLYSHEQTLLSFRRIIEFKYTFNAGLLMGLSVLIYAPAAFYLLMVPAGLVIFKKSLREWIISFVGLLVPLLFAAYLYWGIAGYSFGWCFEQIYQQGVYAFLNSSFLTNYLDPFLLLFWLLLLLIALDSIRLFIQRKQIIRTRPFKTYLYFVWVMILSVVLFVIPGRSLAAFLLIAPALAIVMVIFFDRRPNTVTNIAYLLLLATILAYNLLALLLA